MHKLNECQRKLSGTIISISIWWQISQVRIGGGIISQTGAARTPKNTTALNRIKGANICLYLGIDYPFVSLITNLNMLKSMMSVNVLGTYESHNWIMHFLRAWFLNPQYSVCFWEIWVLLGILNLLILHFHDTQNTICTLIYNIHSLKTHSYTKTISKLLLTKLRETM